MVVVIGPEAVALCVLRHFSLVILRTLLKLSVPPKPHFLAVFRCRPLALDTVESPQFLSFRGSCLRGLFAGRGSR